MGSDQPGRSAEKPVSGATLVIRADASTQIGSGHVMRCLALAEAWQDQGGAVVFVSELPAGVRMRLETEGISVYPLNAEAGSQEDANQVIEVAQGLNTRYITVDGYNFGAEYQKWLKDAGFRLLVLDDNGHADHYYADIVLNQNTHAHESLYPSREPYTRLLLGTRYALLRREFWAWRDWQRDIPEVARKVLVTMGGGDPDNVTSKVLRALEHIEVDNLEVKIIVGVSNPHCDALQEVARQSPHTIQLVQNADDMPALMAWADVAVTAGGSTCWELAFMGLPGILIVLADNQHASAERLGVQGMVLNLGWHADLTPAAIAEPLTLLLERAEHRKRISLHGRELVDSRGSERVVKSLRQAPLSLRPVGMQDRELLWQWANDPAVRQSAFNSDPISWDEHVRWFARKQEEPGCYHFIAFDQQGHPVGQIRFDRTGSGGSEAEVDVSIGRDKRGSGYGTLLIERGVGLLSQMTPIHIVHALIKTENKASIQAFQKAGFKLLQTELVQGESVEHLIWKRNR
jgi:UDP-2,4-diacetamido-2,4,6-trideoxy-beta-L-altropyranose hydrolase